MIGFRQVSLPAAFAWCLATMQIGCSAASASPLPSAAPQHPSIERRYAFPATRVLESAGAVANDPDTLQYEPVHSNALADEGVGLVPGPKARTKALRIDRGSLAALPFMPGPAGFAVEIWFRKNGPGAIRGNGGATNGTLVAVGGGYWDGFRVTTTYPEQTFGFEIGRPSPNSSAGLFGCGPLPDGVWHHLVATWDRREMCLYLDGVLAGSAAYSGPFTPGDRFRIGYADAGWGSVKLDVAEVTLYPEPVGADFVLKRFLNAAALPPGAGYLLHAEEAIKRRDPSACVDDCARVIKEANVPPDLRAVARLLLARCAEDMSRESTAFRALGAILADARTQWALRRTALMRLAARGLDNAGLPANLLMSLSKGDVSPAERRALLISAARAFGRAGAVSHALRTYNTVMSWKDTPQTLRRQIQLEEAHLLRGAGKFSEAARLYAKLASADGGPYGMRSYAQLLLARSQIALGDVKAARLTLQEIMSDRVAPASHRLEAQDLARRIGAGAMKHSSNGRTRVPNDPKPGRTLYVSPTGSDANPGTRANPLRSFAGAVAAIRRIKTLGTLPRGGIRVLFLPGTYPVASPVILTHEDSGSQASPIIYSALPGAKVCFNGSIVLRHFKPVTDASVLAKIPSPARSKVLEADLSPNEAAAVAPLAPHGVGFAAAPVPRLYWNGRALPLARWPKKGWVLTGPILDAGGDGRGFTFQYYGERPNQWVSATDAWLHGYWGWLWADTAVRLASVNTERHSITTAQPSAYTPRPGMPWFAYNLIEELETPGEWCLDRANRRVYLIPPADTKHATIELSALDGPFVKMQDASDIRFQHLCFEAGSSTGIEGDRCTRIAIEGCVLRKLGGTAIVLNHAQDCLVFGCLLHELARGGVVVSGGDRKTLTPGNNVVENCVIHDFSQWDHTYTPAVLAEGVGARIAHNCIYNSPGHALRIEGNDHVIEFNEIHHVITETDDQGALDMWFNPSYRGVVIRYNFFHHMGDGTDRLMHAGVRLDDAISGVVIYGNLFWKASEGSFGAVQIHGGKENIVENNLFVDCKYALSFSPWGGQRWRTFLQSPEVVRALEQDVDIRNPPYITRYPSLGQLAEQPDVNFIWRNVAVRCTAFMIRDGGREQVMDNVETAGDPGFLAPARGDFALKPGSWIFKCTGFAAIPIHEIGPYSHPWRVGSGEW
ncbi:MAG: right-handed parallel beta-helix repeat-containing protein [Chthonomonadales bacterium]